MLRISMSSRVGFGWRIKLATLKVMLLLTWVVVISLRCSLMLDVGCSMLVVIGTLSCLICIDL